MHNKVLKDIIKAKELIIHGTTKSNYFENLYPFTNENLNSLFSNFNFKEKKCLTVLGSSDQALEMCFNGCENITAFDINPLTKYYFDLKKAALLSNLSLEEYINFFCYLNFKGYSDEDNINAFNNRTFKKIQNFLSEESYLFWQSLYDSFNPIIIRKPVGLFKYDEQSQFLLSKTLNYFNEKNFEILKNNIKNLDFNFYNCNILSLPNIVKEKFDFIYLSNIIQYTFNLYKTNKKQELEMFKKLCKNISKNLTNDGKLVLGYIYSINMDYNNAFSAIKNKTLRQEVFTPSEYDYLKFRSMKDILYEEKYHNNSDDFEDGCIIYTKKRF